MVTRASLTCILFKSIAKEKWQWRTYFSTKRRTVGEDISEESIFQSLDQLWNEIMEQEKKCNYRYLRAQIDVDIFINVYMCVK